MIHMRDVSKIYDNGAVALDRASVDIESGEFVFIVGASGAGKSTFIKMLFREELPSSGELVVNGHDIRKMTRKEVPYLRRELGVIFQDYRLLPDKTVFENVAFAMQVIEAPRRLMQRSVNSVLDVVGLRDKYKCFPHQLSGGEQQRVAIARASVNERAGTSWTSSRASTARARPSSWRRTTRPSSTRCAAASSRLRTAASCATRREGGMDMKLQTSEYFIQEVFRSLRRNNWMSFASIGTVAVSLFVLGVFLLLVLNMNRMASALESQVQISVYLEDGLSADDRKDIASDIEALQGIESIRYISKDEAKARLEDRLGDQKYLLDALGDKNPLPDSFEVVVKSPDLVETAAKAIDRMDGVQEAKYGQDVIEHLFAITRLIRIFGLVLMVLLAGATLFIISNTIRLTVFARRKEIAIMKYVGATDWFIRWPFLLEGMVLGFVGGVIAAVALRSFYAAMAAKITDTLTFFPLMPQYPSMNYITVALLLTGMAIGALGSALSLKRFLKV